MLWQVEQPPAAGNEWVALRPDRVLFDYGEPLLFTVKDARGGLNLAYLCDDSEDEEPLTRRYFVAISSAKIVEALERGQCSMRESLDQPRTWLVDVVGDWEVREYWTIQPSDMPADALPPPGVRLSPALEPLISLRAVGGQIVRGAVPGEVIKHLVTGLEGALKRLLDYTLDRENTGRVPNSVRNFYTLPVRSFSFNSFQLDFQDPSADQLTLGEGYDESGAAAFRDSIELLVEGLAWARSGFQEEMIAAGERPRAQAIMEAIKALTPSVHGKIERLEVGGRVHAGQTVTFTKESRREVNRVLTTLNQPRPRPFDDTGLVRELDLDALSFILRECERAAAEVKCSFEPELLDAILNAFNAGQRVRVLGVVQPPRWKVVDVLLVTEAADAAEES